MNKRFISALAGTIVVGGALSVAIAQNKAVADANGPSPRPGIQEMTAGQMLNYMKEQGTKYIVETTDIPKEKKFEVNLTSTKPDEVARAVAKALDMRATKEGNVWVFKNDEEAHMFSFGPGDMNFDFEFKDMPQFDGKAFAFSDEDFKELKNLKGFEGKDWNQMTPEEKAKFEKIMAEFGEKMKVFGEKMGNMKFEFKGPDGKAFKFDNDTFKNFKGKNWDKMTPEEKEKFEREMAKVKEELKNMKVEINGKNSEEFKKDMERMKDEIKKSVHDGMAIHIENTDKLIKSISTDQWKLMETQGHLKLSDLTKEQLELIGNPKGDGDFNISISRDGKKLIIKN
jgi:hypothetical protein